MLIVLSINFSFSLRDRLQKAEKIIIECRKDQLFGSDGDAGEAIQVAVFTYQSSGRQVI